MNKLVINICSGIHCSVMGGADLQLLGDFLPEELFKRIELRHTPCMGECRATGSGSAPYVEVDNRMISQATLNKVVGAIQDYFEQHKSAY